MVGDVLGIVGEVNWVGPALVHQLKLDVKLRVLDREGQRHYDAQMRLLNPRQTKEETRRPTVKRGIRLREHRKQSGEP